ncbi:MAG: acyltransferase family protein, partial [Alphaproteobacteria bacterium]|nr:acyltransferase family protein [Alphaproteobacteria bacterium]
IASRSSLVKNAIYCFSAPLLFFMSGYLFRVRPNERFGDFAKKKIKSIVLPCTFLCIIIILFSMLWQRSTAPLSMVKLLFLQTRPSWPTWYMACLFILNLYMFLLVRVTDQFEGKKRMEIADNSLENFIKEVDSIIVIQNQNLFNVATENTTLPEAFKMADNVLYSGVRSITDLMMMPGLINLDFADVKNIMEDKGKAIMGTGEAEGKGRAKEAANQALSNPLLDECSLQGAKGVLINITGSKDIPLPELDEAANIIKEEVGDDANIIFGSSYDDNLQGKIRVSIVVTGINGNDERKPEPVKVAQPQPSLIEQSYDDLTVVPTVNVEPENSFTSSLDLENPFELDETFSDDPLPDDEADVTKFADDDFATLDKSDELPEVPQASALFNAIRNSDGKTEETEQAIEELSSAALQDDFFSSKTDIENTNDDDLVLFTDNDTSIFKDTPLTTDTEEKAEPVAEVHEEESKPNFFSRIGFGSRKKNREEAENNNDEHLVAEKTGTDDEFDLSAEELDIPAFLRR